MSSIRCAASGIRLLNYATCARSLRRCLYSSRCSPLLSSISSINNRGGKGSGSAVNEGCSDTPSCSSTTISRRWIGGLGGKFSRMLDMGGSPSSANDRSAAKALNLNKNCHLQAVIFDFNVLTQSLTEQQQEQPQIESLSTRANPTANAIQEAIVPDVARIQELAEILKVDLTGASRKDLSIEDQPFEDDLTLLLGQQAARNSIKETASTQAPPPLPQQQPQPRHRHAIYQDTANDIRSKYADKLQRAVGGGVGMVDRTKSDDSDKKGDAAGHFAARARATAIESSSSSSSSSAGGAGAAAGKWMAATGTGQLLGYLHMRSMKLGLAATPVAAAAAAVAPKQNDVSSTSSPNDSNQEPQRMQDFAKQIRDKVKFDAVVTQDGSYTATKLVEATLTKLLAGDGISGTTTTPDRCLWVSDRDDCLRAAKEAGLLTARIVRPNARRGNVSAHYTVESVPQVQMVINEINGISFNTVLQQRP